MPYGNGAFWEHQIRDWPNSPFHPYVRLGLYLQDWAGAELLQTDGGYGEPEE